MNGTCERNVMFRFKPGEQKIIDLFFFVYTASIVFDTSDAAVWQQI